MRVLIAEPELQMAETLAGTFEKAKIQTDTIAISEVASLAATAGETGFNYWGLILADSHDLDHILERLRAVDGSVPIVCLLPLRNSERAITLLSAGADDVLVKPTNPKEIAARLRAILRRGNGHDTSTMQIGKLTVHLDGRDPEVDGQRLKLSHREHSIFTHLALHAGRVVPKESVYEAVYGMLDSQPYDKVIDVYICKLRKKLQDATGEQYIETVYGRGYKLDLPEKTQTVRLGRRAEDETAEEAPALPVRRLALAAAS
jgi:two-component system cell cycle response regulator CtrA